MMLNDLHLVTDALAGLVAPAPPALVDRVSEFERDVLTATRHIPAGQIRPYGWIARCRPTTEAAPA